MLATATLDFERLIPGEGERHHIRIVANNLALSHVGDFRIIKVTFHEIHPTLRDVAAGGEQLRPVDTR